MKENKKKVGRPSNRIQQNGKLRCSSKRHQDDRMMPIADFCKAKTPDGLSYSCKSCRTKENKELCNARYRRYKRNPRSKIIHMLGGRKSGAKKMNIPFDLTVEDIHIPDICPVLGIPMFFSENGRTDNTPSLDRLDNSKGYTKDNILIISWRANFLKRDASLIEIEKLIAFYTNILEEKYNVGN